MRTVLTNRVWLVVAAVLVLNSAQAWAVGSSGFENASLSTRSLARSNASVADAEKPDVVAFNPAGLSKLDGTQFYAGATPILLSTHYDGAKGRIDEDASETVIPVPYLYGSWQTPLDKLTLGVGSNAPFGLITKYSSVGNFRHIAYFNDIKAAGYYLSGAYELVPGLSVGAGWTHLDVDLTQVGKFNSLALTGDTQDAPYEYDVDGDGEGYNLGLLWDVTDKDTIGAFYRSEVRAHLKGFMSTHDLTGTIAAVFGGASNVTSADTDITLPANVTLAYRRQVNDKLDVEFDLGWTGWSSYDTVDTVFGTSNAILAGFEHLGKDYRDVYSLHVGGSYDVNENWTVSSGYLYYQRAANKSNYTNENPDGDRHAVSIGVERSFGNWSLEAMYMAMWVTEQEIENTAGLSNGTDIDGTYSGFLNIVSMGLAYKY